MHTKEAVEDDENKQPLTNLSAWQEAPLYIERERAVLVTDGNVWPLTFAPSLVVVNQN